MGQGAHQSQGNALTLSSEPTDASHPLAPAPLPVLAGVVVYVLLGSIFIDLGIKNDYLAVFAFVAVVATGVFALNKAGVEQARRRPHRLYRKFKLPADALTRKLRAAALVLTAVVLIVVVTLLAKPGEVGSPLPYFVAVIFIYLVVPQLNGRLAVRRYDQNQK